MKTLISLSSYGQFESWKSRFEAQGDHIPEKIGLIHDALIPLDEMLILPETKIAAAAEYAERIIYLLRIADAGSDEYPVIRSKAKTAIAHALFTGGDLGEAGADLRLDFPRSVGDLIIGHPELCGALVHFYRTPKPAKAHGLGLHMINLPLRSKSQKDRQLYDLLLDGCKKLCRLLIYPPLRRASRYPYLHTELRTKYLKEIISYLFWENPQSLLQLRMNAHQKVGDDYPVLSSLHSSIFVDEGISWNSIGEWIRSNAASQDGAHRFTVHSEVYLILLARAGLLESKYMYKPSPNSG